MSIVGGTLPLEFFGRDGYGAHVGWITGARQFIAAFAPFGLTLLMDRLGVLPLWLNAVIAGLWGSRLLRPSRCFTGREMQPRRVPLSA